MKDTWVVYLIKSTISNRTYIGCSNNYERRLKQHNGLLSGGAKYTHTNRPWEIVLIISGLNNKQLALCLEWRLKRDTKMKTVSGLEKRILNVFNVLNLDRFTKKCMPTDNIEKIDILFCNNYFHENYCLLNEKDNVYLDEV
jgi:putative endonuclease